MSFLYDNHGNRKYTTIKERKAFLQKAQSDAPCTVFTFCIVLAYTGARISEVLALTPRQIDCEAGVIIIRSLKKPKRQKPTYRAIPVPARLLNELDAIHGIKAAQQDRQHDDTDGQEGMHLSRDEVVICKLCHVRHMRYKAQSNHFLPCHWSRAR